MANATMTLISSQVLGSTTATVTFSSIPTTYNDLRLIVSTKDTTSAFPVGGLNLVFNSDVANNYSVTVLAANYSTGTTPTSGRNSGQVQSTIGYGATSLTGLTNIFSNGDIYILNYNTTGSKQIYAQTLTEQSASQPPGMELTASLYRGTSGITSIAISCGGSFVANSSFYLYGIKNS